MAGIDVDVSGWPIVFAKLPPVASDAEVEEYLRQLRVFRERREPYALIIDASDSKGFTPTQRRMQAEHIASGLALSRVYLRALNIRLFDALGSSPTPLFSAACSPRSSG